MSTYNPPASADFSDRVMQLSQLAKELTREIEVIQAEAESTIYVD